MLLQITPEDINHIIMPHAFTTAEPLMCKQLAAGHESWVLSVACHPSGKSFATGSSDSKVKLWDMSSRSCAQTLSEHSDQVWDVAFNVSGNRLASVSDDKNICLYDYQQ
jgi:WD40 repeat protein